MRRPPCSMARRQPGPTRRSRSPKEGLPRRPRSRRGRRHPGLLRPRQPRPGLLKSRWRTPGLPGPPRPRWWRRARWSRRPRMRRWRRSKPRYRPRSKTYRHRRRALRRFRQPPPPILPGGRRWRTPRRPATQSSQPRLLPRGAQPLSGFDPSPAGGTAHGFYGGAGTTLRGSLCSPLRTWLRGELGLLRAISPASGAVAADSAERRG